MLRLTLLRLHDAQVPSEEPQNARLARGWYAIGELLLWSMVCRWCATEQERNNCQKRCVHTLRSSRWVSNSKLMQAQTITFLHAIVVGLRLFVVPIQRCSFHVLVISVSEDNKQRTANIMWIEREENKGTPITDPQSK